ANRRILSFFLITWLEKTNQKGDTAMSIVIIGGNERMVARYENLCQDYGCKAKVFVKEHGSIRKKMGCPDLLLLFTNTVSHKMVMNASQEAKRNKIPIVRIHRSSTAALQSVLEEIKGGAVYAG